MREQVCLPLSHIGLVIGNKPEGGECIIAAYAEKKKTWKEDNKNIHETPSQGENVPPLSDRYLLPPAPNKFPLTATARPNYLDTLGSDSDDETEFRSEIDIDHPQEHLESINTSEATKVRGIDNL